MSGLTQMDRLRIVHREGSLPWIENDGWLGELRSARWVETYQAASGIRYRITAEGRRVAKIPAS